MKNKIVDKLLSIFDEVFPQRWSLPVEPDYIINSTIEYGLDSKNFLVIQFADSLPKYAKQMFDGYKVEPTEINELPLSGLTVMQLWIHPSVHLGPGSFKYVTYSYGSSTVRGDVIKAGETLALISTNELRIGFVTSKDHAGKVRYLDPAVVVRILAYFDEQFSNLISLVIKNDPEGHFHLDGFLSAYDSAGTESHRKLLLKEALKNEYFLIKDQEIVMSPSMEIKYTDRIGKVLGTSAKKSDVLFSFPTQVEADPDHFAYYFIEDMGLYLAVFYEDKYDLELIDTRMPGLPDWPTDFVSLKDAGTGCKIIVNGPLFDAGECGLQPWYTRAKEYTLAALDDYTTGLYKGLVKGTLYLRNGLRASGECPIPDDPDVWRYYFAQRYTGVYEFKLGRLPTPDTLPVPPQPDGIAVAVEPLYGVFREGKRIGIGHEIDTDRQEPDSVFADKPIKQGIPIIGRCQKDGRIFLFVLMRPDSWFDPDLGSTWEQIVSLLRELQVIEAFITDGDDSVGLIIDDEVILEPGAKKNTLMPLAIGFKRRNP